MIALFKCMRSTVFARQSCYSRSLLINLECIVGLCDSPRVLLSLEIHTFCRTKDQWAPAQCHNRLKRDGGGIKLSHHNHNKRPGFYTT